MNRKHWWIGITALAVLGAVGFGYIGVETYKTVPAHDADARRVAAATDA